MKLLIILASVSCLATAQIEEQPEVAAARAAHAAYYDYLRAVNAAPTTQAPVYRHFPTPEINHFIPQYFPPPPSTPAPPKLKYLTSEAKVEAQEFGKVNKNHLQETQFPTKKAYTGPLASHTLGQYVQDTPEVSYSKQKHLETYAAILRQNTHVSTTQAPQNFNSQKLLDDYYYHNKYNQLKNAPVPVEYDEPEYEPEPVAPPKQLKRTGRPRVEQPQPEFNHFLPSNFPEPEAAKEYEQYAEDIEYGPTGEVLEVYNARQAHLKAVELTRKVLPPLPKQAPNKVIKSVPVVDEVQRRKELARIAAIRALQVLAS